MEGMLYWWALAIQEYDFEIVYWKGKLNTNTDALSHWYSPCAATQTIPSLSTVRSSHCTADRHQHIKNSKAYKRSTPPKSPEWHRQPLRRYRQLWAQLQIVDGVLCRKSTLSPLLGPVTVPIVPPSLRHVALTRCHDAPSAGHLGAEWTLERLRQEAYWIGMADVEWHCRECNTCQKTKAPMPQRSPLINSPIGRPWQMVAVDVLEVPISCNNNRYQLVVYKMACYHPPSWSDSILDINWVCKTLLDIWPARPIPHSCQGWNFESTILSKVLEAVGIEKTCTTAYHPQGDGMVEWLNRSLLQLHVEIIHRQEWRLRRTSPISPVCISHFNTHLNGCIPIHAHVWQTTKNRPYPYDQLWHSVLWCSSPC